MDTVTQSVSISQSLCFKSTASPRKEGKVVIRRKLKRRYVLAFFQNLPPCFIVEAVLAASLRRSR
jgi:hypothetical protein